MNNIIRPDPNLLRKSRLLHGASTALVFVFEDVSQTQNLKKGSSLFEQGDFGDSLFILKEGALEVSVLSSQGRKLSLNILRTGEVFGEIALFDPGPRTASICAITPSKLVCVPRKRLFEALASKPELALEMLNLAGKRLRWISNRLEEHVFLPVEARLALKILHFIDHGADPANTIRMSQTALADHVGATREAVSKILSSWKRSGFVDIKRSAVEVLDHEQLEEIARPDFI